MKKSRLIRGVLIPVGISICFVKCLAPPALSIDAERTPPPDPSRPVVEMKFREMHFGKPPLVYLYFDVVLRNKRAEPRWFLLPSNLPESASVGARGGVDTVEVFAPQGKGRVIIGHFLGTGGFQALLLPAGAEVRLRIFPISYWGDLPDQLQVEVVMAKRLLIGGEGAEAWFGVNPTSSVKADIAESPENWTRSASSRSTPDNKEVATLIEEDSRIRLQVSLGEKNKDSPRHTKLNKSRRADPRFNLMDSLPPGRCQALP